MMKTTSILLAADSALALGACTTTTAQTVDATKMASVEGEKAYVHKDAEKKMKKEADAKPQRRSMGGGHSKADFFNTYDADEDGTVTTAEYRAVRDEGYDARDPDGDARVMPDEYVAEYEARLEQDLAAQRDRQIKQAYVRFGILDADKDGILTREEFQASGQNMFQRLDTNEDGLVNDADTKDAY